MHSSGGVSGEEQPGSSKPEDRKTSAAFLRMEQAKRAILVIRCGHLKSPEACFPLAGG